jgi:hypothetical protein
MSSVPGGKAIDSAQKSQFFTLDSIMEIATGIPIGDLEHNTNVYRYLKTTANALAPLVIIGSVPAVANILQIQFVAKKLFPTA